MYNPISSVLRKATRQSGEPLNILCASTHERYQSGFSNMPHKFYLYNHESFKPWVSHYAALPDNHIILDKNKGENQLPSCVDFDLVFSANKFGQFQILSKIARALNIPLISLEHTTPPPNWTEKYIKYVGKMRGNINAFITKQQAEAWLWEDDYKLCPIGIDTNIFKPLENTQKKKHILAVANDIKNRDIFCGYNLLIQSVGDLQLKLLGDNPGISQPAKDTNELIQHYNEATVFLSTTTKSTLPTTILEAMACGLPVVSTKHCGINENIIESGISGYCSNDPAELHGYCEMLLYKPELAKKIGEAGRQRIIEKFSVDNFVKNWENIFQEAI